MNLCFSWPGNDWWTDLYFSCTTGTWEWLNYESIYPSPANDTVHWPSGLPWKSGEPDCDENCSGGNPCSGYCVKLAQQNQNSDWLAQLGDCENESNDKAKEVCADPSCTVTCSTSTAEPSSTTTAASNLKRSGKSKT